MNPYRKQESREMKVARWLYSRRTDHALVREAALWASVMARCEEVPDDIVALYDECQRRGLGWYCSATAQGRVAS